MRQTLRHASLHPQSCPRAVRTFFTVVLLERHRHLLTEYLDALRTVLTSMRRQRPFQIDAIIVLSFTRMGSRIRPPLGTTPVDSCIVS